MGLGKQVVSLVIDHLYLSALDELLVITGFDTGSPGKDDLVVVLIGFHGLEHRREVVFDLLLAGTGKQGYYFRVERGKRRVERDMICPLIILLIINCSIISSRVFSFLFPLSTFL